MDLGEEIDNIEETAPIFETKRKGRPPGSPNKEKTSKPDSSPKSVRVSRPQWPKEASVRKALTSILDGGSFALEFVSPTDAAIVNKHSEAIISEIVALALIEPRYRKTLEKLALPGIYGPLIMALGPMIFDIAKNHHLFDMGTRVKSANLVTTEDATTVKDDVYE